MIDEAKDWQVVPASQTHAVVEAWSRLRLPFQPKGSMREFQLALGRAIQQLTAAEGQILYATYRSSSPDLCDAENVLIYNPGTGRFAKSTREGLQFERLFTPLINLPTKLPTAAHYYRYEIVPNCQPLVYWQTGRRLAHFQVRLDLGMEKPAAIWYALKRGSLETDSNPLSADGTFMLQLALESTTSTPKHAALVIKVILDGVVSALQSHGDGATLGEASQRIAASVGAASAEVSRLLTDSRMAVLGSTRLVDAYRQDVKWNPCDHRCVATTFLIDRKSKPLEHRFLTGSVFEAVPVA